MRRVTVGRSRLLLALALAVLSVASTLYLLGSNGDANLPRRPTGFMVVGGTAQAFSLVATDEPSREKGLMGANITESTFALFAFPTAARHSFWMKGTASSLDIVWINGTIVGGTVVFVLMNLPLCTVSSCPIYTPSAPANFAIEGAAGFAARLEIANGTRIAFSFAP